jgi:hypothetical protein
MVNNRAEQRSTNVLRSRVGILLVSVCQLTDNEGRCNKPCKLSSGKISNVSKHGYGFGHIKGSGRSAMNQKGVQGEVG